MNTAFFELLGKLATGAGTTQSDTPVSPLAPLQTSLPTGEDCVVYGQEKPLLFFYDPNGANKANNNINSNSVVGAGAMTVMPSDCPPSASPSTAPSFWPAELSAAQLAAPTTSIQVLCVTAAEDDVGSRLPNSEVWPDWPQTVSGWQLCPMSHLCAVVRIKAVKSAESTGTTTSMGWDSAFLSYYLLASRYELVGTSAVYERYLLLSTGGRKSKTHGIDDIVGGAQTSISVHELRELRRVACLCRCFCTNGCEVRPRPAGGDCTCALQALRNAAPPAPPADYFLRLVPTSLQYTFCFTTTALLSVAEEERCQNWAMVTTKLSQPPQKIGNNLWQRHRSCSTEAVNTSGALSDGGHTVYQDSSFTRECSASAVRVVDSAAALGYSEDPRSATPTPARPVAAGRLDEQQPQQQKRYDSKRGSLERTQESELERRLPQSQRWRAFSLLRLVDTAFYDDQVPAGWRRWRYASSGILCRPLVVDSLDGIVRYIHGSRLAFYTAVAFLDRFIATTVDPISNLQAYRCQIYRARTGQEMDFSMMAGSGMGGPGSSDLHNGAAFHADGRADPQLHSSYSDDVHARDICGFLTQVIVVCIMLGSKTVDLYPPSIRQLMGCVEDTAPISEHEFVILELHVLLTLGFPVHPVTLFESVNALLTFSTSDDLIGTLTASHTTRRLLEEYQDRGHLVDDVEKLFMEQKAKDAASTVRSSGVTLRPLSGAATASTTLHGQKAGAVHNHHHHYGGRNARPTESLTHADRQTINDWLRLRLFAYFICDEVIRADATGSSSASSSNANSRHNSPHNGDVTHHCSTENNNGEEDDEDEWSDGFNILQYSPVLVATAALVTAAEQACLPLPTPLLRLLPQSLRDRLREADTATEDSLRMRLRFGSNGDSSPLGFDSASSSLSPSPSSSPSAAAGPLRLTAQPADDNYAVLEELSLLLEAELVRLSAVRRSLGRSYADLLSPSRAAEEGQMGEMEYTAAAATVSSLSASLSGHIHRKHVDAKDIVDFAGSGEELREAFASRGTSSSSALPRADPYAVELFGQVICQVKVIHERSRESCPPVLLQRYQPLFREVL